LSKIDFFDSENLWLQFESRKKLGFSIFLGKKNNDFLEFENPTSDKFMKFVDYDQYSEGDKKLFLHLKFSKKNFENKKILICPNDHNKAKINSIKISVKGKKKN